MKHLIVDRDVDIPMRDGIITRADIYRPAGDGPFPVLLQRTPYGKKASSLDLALLAAESGYAVVVQDTRGRWASEGEHYPFLDEFADGYDSVQWAGAQPWSSGIVGMIGGSYVSYTQWAAAVTRPPSLRAIFPSVSWGDSYADLVYPGDVLALGVAMSWSLGAGVSMAIERLGLGASEKAALMDQFLGALDGMATWETYTHLPLDAHPLVGRDGLVSFVVDWLDNGCDPAYWRSISFAHRYRDVLTPAYHLGGWYDIFAAGTLRNYTGMCQHGGSEKARRGQKLIMGPWLHGPLNNVVGTVDFGFRATGIMENIIGLQLRWFDHWLKGEPNGIMEEPPVRIFVMGTNRWRNEEAWPLARAVVEKRFLRSGGAANSSRGDGLLSQSPPVDEPADAYLYDPRNPVPTRGGGLCCYAAALPAGAFDQRDVEARPDVLVYSTEPLGSDTEVTGSVTAHLWVSTTAPETCFTAKLVDVSPGGFARNVVDGIKRVAGTGDPLEVVIELGPTCNVFLAGHRIRLEVSSSNFPRFDRHPNTLGMPQSEADLRTALQTIWHNGAHPSHVALPIVV